MSKLTRGAYRTFLDAAFGGTGTPKWWRLGKYTDDLSVNLNPDVSSNKNVWDESYVDRIDHLLCGSDRSDLSETARYGNEPVKG